MSRPLKPIRDFSGPSGIEEFARRHKAGTEAEFAATQKLVDKINKEDNKFQAWVVSKTRETSKRLEYLIIVQPGQDGERKIPQQGEPGRVRVVFGDNDFTRFWDARRIENPLAQLNIKVRSPEKIAAYQVTVHIADAHDGVQPLIDTSSTSSHTSRATTPDTQPADGLSDAGSTGDSGIGDCKPNPTIGLTDENSVRVNFHLTASEATKNAEIYALEQFCGRYKGKTSERQQKAFEYFVNLRDPAFSVNLHEMIPHLTSIMDDPSWPDSPLAKKFDLLNPQQKAAYLEGFLDLPCGVCILPGGPGAGKTHFNLFTVAMAQSRPLPPRATAKGRSDQRFAKVLFIVDMNCPVDDVANRMMRLYKELGMNKLIIRMKGWGAELVTSDRLNAVEDTTSGDTMLVDFTNQFLRTRDLMSLSSSSGRRSCQAPSLDEAAWQRYDEHKTTMYAELTEYLEGELWETNDIVPLRLRRLIYNLYRDTLAAADFIATTPVAASNHFRGMFKPDLVYFDESPHARELTNLIAIANFNPIAWIFCGDYRQTVPYVSSDGDNEYREQMQVSMMERAAFANAIPYELLMNHRSFGGLEKLASNMFYRGRMVSGNEGRTPDLLTYMREYLGRLAGRPCTVPRAVVHLTNCGPEARDGTSAYNPSHIAWAMASIRELLSDPKFTGTILIMAFYKKAYNEYKEEVKKLSPSDQRRVEARTVDVAQGHEADVVFLDLVKENSTKFLDDPNRLNVALTRGRMCDIIMIHPNMVNSENFRRHSRHLRRMYNFCKDAGQVVYVDSADTAATPSTPSASATESTPTVMDVVADSGSDISDSAVSVLHDVGETQASHASEDSAPAEEQMVTVADQTSAEVTVTDPVSDTAEKVVIDEPATPAAPALSPTADSEPVREMAPIDDGELWWNTVMSRTTQVQVVAGEEKKVLPVEEEKVVTVEDEKVVTAQEAESVVTAGEEERATISQPPVEVEVTSTAHETSEPLVVEEISALAPIEETAATVPIEDTPIVPIEDTATIVPTPSHSTEDKGRQEVASIDDGELWWALVMNRAAQVQVVTTEEEGRAPMSQLAAEEAATDVAHEPSEKDVTEEMTAAAVSTENTAITVPVVEETITSVPIEDSATAVPTEDSTTAVLTEESTAVVLTEDTATIDPIEETANIVSIENTTITVSVEEAATTVSIEEAVTSDPTEEIATVVPAAETAAIAPIEETAPIPPVASDSAEDQCLQEVASIDDGELWWNSYLAMKASTRIATEKESALAAHQSTAADTVTSLAHEVGEKLAVEDMTTVRFSLAACTVENDRVEEATNIDGREHPSNPAMNGPTHVAAAQEEGVAVVTQLPTEDAATSLTEDISERIVKEETSTSTIAANPCTIEETAAPAVSVVSSTIKETPTPAARAASPTAEEQSVTTSAVASAIGDTPTPVVLDSSCTILETPSSASPAASDTTEDRCTTIRAVSCTMGGTPVPVIPDGSCTILGTPSSAAPAASGITEDKGTTVQAVSSSIGDTPVPVIPAPSRNILETPSSAAPAASDTMENKSAPDITAIDDCELWWSQAMKRLALPITAEKKATVAPKPPPAGSDTGTSPDHDIMEEVAEEPTTTVDPAAPSTVEKTEIPVVPGESSITKTEDYPIKDAEDEVWTHVGDDAADELDKQADEMIKLAEQMRSKAAENVAAETDRLAEQKESQKAEKTIREVAEDNVLRAAEERMREEAERAHKKAEEEARRVVNMEVCKQHEEEDGLGGLAMLIAQVLRWGWEHKVPVLRN